MGRGIFVGRGCLVIILENGLHLVLIIFVYCFVIFFESSFSCFLIHACDSRFIKEHCFY